VTDGQHVDIDCQPCT